MTQVAAKILLILGLILLASGLYAPFDPDNTPEEKRSGLVACLLFSTPMLIGSGWLMWRSQQRKLKQESDRLQSIFLQLLQTEQGRLTPLRFAMESALEYKLAKAYLDAKALELNANFEVDDQGNVLYAFPISGLPLPTFNNDLSLSLPQVPSTQQLDVIMGVVPANQKLAAIKIVREFTGLGLKEAKKTINAAPQHLPQFIRSDQWVAFESAMTAIGVQVRQADHLD
ncbi:ribosomal protein L7/L12 [Trichothermofontia sp.]